LYDVQILEAEEYPFDISQGISNLGDCYAASYLYEGLFGNERSVELANEGF